MQDLVAFMQQHPDECGIIYARLRCGAWDAHCPPLNQAACPAAVHAREGGVKARGMALLMLQQHCSLPAFQSERSRPRGAGWCVVVPRDRNTCDWLVKTLAGYDLDVGVYHAGEAVEVGEGGGR